MSQRVINWVLEDAPVTNATQLIILIALAFGANDDGTCSGGPPQSFLATRARCSVRTIGRHLKALEKAGVLRRGNQDLAYRLSPNSGPVVYDLAVECTRMVRA